METKSIQVSEELHKKIKAFCLKHGLKIKCFINDSIKEALKTKEKK